MSYLLNVPAPTKTTRRPPTSKKGRMTVALRDAEQAMRAIQKAGSTGAAGDSWRPAKEWLERHARLLASLDDYG